MKLGVVDVGGGMRGIYAAGVFDRCMDDGVMFDLAIGVSAGSANVASYVAHQRGRNYRFYTDYAFRKEYMSMGQYLKTGSFINMEYVYSTLSNSTGEDPVDYDTFAASPIQVLTVATDARTGKAKYFTKADYGPDNFDVIKASCSLPFVCKPYEVGGVPYYDGALGDPVPVRKALAEGCDRVVLILTKPADRPRQPGRDPEFAKLIQKHYPAAADALLKRAENYNEAVEFTKELEKEGRALIIAPDDTCGVDTLTRDKSCMDRLYQKGRIDGEKVKPFLER